MTWAVTTFELCAPGELNRYDVARLISDVSGRKIEAKKIDPDSLGDKANPMRPMFEHYERVGLLGNSLTLHAILQHEPRTLRDYFIELASSTAS